MAENYSNSSSMEKMNFINLLMHNYKNVFTKRCRTCSSVIKDNGCIYSFKLNAKETSLRDKLYSCCPEFDIRPNLKTILCLNCLKIINIIYEFIHKYDKSKGQLHSNFSFSPLSIANVHLVNNVENEIKTEEVDLSDTEISLNVHEQMQSIKNTHICLQSNMKTTACIVEESLKNSQCNDAIYKIISKESSSIHAEEGPLKYSYRHNSSNTNNTLIKCYPTHARDAPFKCFQCDYSCTHKCHLSSHLRIHTGSKPFKCLQCDFRTAHKNCLISHFHTHTGDKPFKCLQCDFRTARKNYLKCHLHTHTGDKPFQCSQCEYKTAQKSDLLRHFRRHTGDKPFKCSQCDFKTAYKPRLVSHFRTHTGEKPFKCSQCDYSCTQKGHLSSHLHIHTGNKPFKCLQCDFRTARKNYLKCHLHTHTGNKPFQCSRCEYKTAQKSDLIRHFRRHTKDKPFKCSQ